MTFRVAHIAGLTLGADDEGMAMGEPSFGSCDAALIGQSTRRDVWRLSLGKQRTGMVQGADCGTAAFYDETSG